MQLRPLSNEEYRWLTHPENLSGFPAIYECTECGAYFSWFETDGEAGSYCTLCAPGRTNVKRPRKIASATKWKVELPPPPMYEPSPISAFRSDDI